MAEAYDVKKEDRCHKHKEEQAENGLNLDLLLHFLVNLLDLIRIIGSHKHRLHLRRRVEEVTHQKKRPHCQAEGAKCNKQVHSKVVI